MSDSLTISVRAMPVILPQEDVAPIVQQSLVTMAGDMEASIRAQWPVVTGTSREGWVRQTPW